MKTGIKYFLRKLIHLNLVLVNIDIFWRELDIVQVLDILSIAIVSVLRIFIEFLILFSTLSYVFYESVWWWVFFKRDRSFRILTRHFILTSSFLSWDLNLRFILINISFKVPLVWVSLILLINQGVFLNCFLVISLFVQEVIYLRIWRIWISYLNFLNVVLFIVLILLALFTVNVLKSLNLDMLMRFNIICKWVEIFLESPFRVHSNIIYELNLLRLMRHFFNCILIIWVLNEKWLRIISSKISVCSQFC